MLHGCSPRVRAFADFVASEIARSRAGVRRSHHTPLNVRAKELHSSHPAPLVKRRLRFNLRLGRGGMSALSPFYPELRTLVGPAGTAVQCQEATYAPQQTSSAHSSSVSARTKNVSGIARPIALADFTLMANSNFVGCSIGRSSGRAPRKILCTNVAPSRNSAGPSAPYDIKPPASTKARVLEAAGKRYSRASSARRLVDKLP